MSYDKMYQEAEEKGQVHDVLPAFVKWENEGDKVIGKYIDRFEVKSQENEGEYNQYLVLTDNGLVKFSLGALADKELSMVLEKGSIYLFRYLGQEKLAKGRRVNRFQVRRMNGVGLEDTHKKGDSEDDS